MLNEVVEYFLDENNYITGWALRNGSKRPDLKDFILPTADMNMGLKDEYGNLKYQLQGFIPVEITREPSSIDLARKELDGSPLKKILKALFDGIENGPSGIKYQNLKDIVYGSNGS